MLKDRSKSYGKVHTKFCLPIGLVHVPVVQTASEPVVVLVRLLLLYNEHLEQRYLISNPLIQILQQLYQLAIDRVVWLLLSGVVARTSFLRLIFKLYHHGLVFLGRSSALGPLGWGLGSCGVLLVLA